MVNFCKYSDTSITDSSDDAEHVTTTTTAVTTCRDDDDEFVYDSLSETEHSPFNNNEHNFYSSMFFESTNTKGNSLLFDGLRNTPRSKIPLKAVDLDSTGINHYLQANDRSLVRNITPHRVVSGYASRDKTLTNRFNLPADHHNN